MGLEHDGATRRLVAATRLHTDITVFDDVEAADAVGTADAVQVGQNGCRGFLDTVNGNDVAVAVGEFDVGGLVRGVLRRDTPAPHVLFVLGPGVFQDTAFVGDVQQVGVHRVRRLLLAVALDRDTVLFGVVHQLFAGQQVPLTPWGDDLDARLERVGTQLETHLVVALAGSAMGNGVCAGFVGDFDEALGDQRAGDGSTQQVLTFVDGVGAEHREHEITHEFFAQVVDVDLFNTHCLSLGAGRFDLFALTQVSGESHHFAVVGILQPLENHRSIKAAGIRQYDLFYVRHAITPRGCTEKDRF